MRKVEIMPPVRPITRITGIDQNTIRHASELQNQRINSEKENLFSQLREIDPLATDEREMLREVEEAARIFYQRKLVRLGLSTDKVKALDPMLYVSAPFAQALFPSSEPIGGMYMAEIDIAFTVIDRSSPESLLVAAKSLQHEIGHQVGLVERRVHRDPILGILGFNTRAGFERVIRGEHKGGILEEGLLTMDMVDFYHEDLAARIPQASTPSEMLTIEQEVDKVVAESLNGAFQPLTQEDIFAFVVKVYEDDMVKLAFTNKQLMVYTLTEGISRLVGYHLLQNLPSSTSIADAQLVALGRDHLDHSRFTLRSPAHATLLKALGRDYTQFLFDLENWPDDEKLWIAMSWVLMRENQLGLVDVDIDKLTNDNV